MGGRSTPDAALSQLSRRAGRPLQLQVLIADRCNHACQHCYQVQGLKGEVSFDEILRVLRGFREAGGMVVTFSGGEATLRADLIELLRACRELDLATVLYTNAYTMTPELAARVAACEVWRVEVSVYSDAPAEHDAVTRVPGSFERTLAGIRALRSHGVNVRIKTALTREASSGMPERLGAIAADLGCDYAPTATLAGREDGDLGSLGARATPAAAAALLEGPRGGDECEPRHADNPLDGAPCGAGGSGLAMRSDGVLQPCTNLQVPYGDLEAAGSVANLLDQSEVAALFRGLRRRDFHGCRDCDLVGDCQRCYASAGVEAGDLLGPYRGACDVAAARHARRSGNTTVLAPSPECAPDRDPRLGPYRVEPDGALRPVPDVITEADEALAVRYPWLRPSADALRRASRGLITLRRGRGPAATNAPAPGRIEGER